MACVSVSEDEPVKELMCSQSERLESYCTGMINLKQIIQYYPWHSMVGIMVLENWVAKEQEAAMWLVKQN